jgi:tetratricopeptide (TPR) repeat protein
MKEDTALVHRYFQICSQYLGQGNNIEVHKFGIKARDLCIKIRDEKGEAQAYNFLGIAYRQMSNLPEALNNYLKGLKLAEKHGLLTLKVNFYDNVGNVFAEQGDKEKALRYYYKAIEVQPDKTNKRVFQTYNNIAIIFAENGDLKTAKNYFQKVYDVAKNNKDTIHMEDPLGNIGNVYLMEGDHEKALSYFNQALFLARRMGDMNKVCVWLESIGGLYMAKDDSKNGERYLKESLQIAESAGVLDVISSVHQQLSEIYLDQGQSKPALEHYLAYVKANDSIHNSVNNNRMIQLEMNYEFSALESEAKLGQEKKDAITAEEHKKNNFIILSFGFTLLLLGGLAFYIYKSYTAKQKANKKLEDQKNIIEEKQHEILSSIHYAKRIQRALLTSEAYIEKNLQRLNHND